MTAPGFAPVGGLPLSSLDPEQSQAVILPYEDALEEQSVELVFVVELDLMVPEAR